MNSQYTLVGHSTGIEQAEFYRKTYSHVAFAILAFIFVETLLLKVVPEQWIYSMVSSRFLWLFIIGLFWLGSTLSTKMAFEQSRERQYYGLGLYVILEAIIFLPMIYIAQMYRPKIG
jgi:FtsH-binding integral membrane protein